MSKTDLDMLTSYSESEPQNAAEEIARFANAWVING